MPAVNGVGKPCAGEPHARFDGRELETEQRSDQGRGDEGHQGKPCGHQRLRDLPSMRVTAPALDPPTTALRWSPHESSQVAHTHQRDSAAVRVFAGKRLELTDDGVSASARDFGFRPNGVSQHFVFHQRGGECVGAWESRKSSRTGARHSANAAERWLLACFESARGGGVDTRGPFGGEPS